MSHSLVSTLCSYCIEFHVPFLTTANHFIYSNCIQSYFPPGKKQNTWYQANPSMRPTLLSSPHPLFPSWSREQEEPRQKYHQLRRQLLAYCLSVQEGLGLGWNDENIWISPKACTCVEIQYAYAKISLGKVPPCATLTQRSLAFQKFRGDIMA